MATEIVVRKWGNTMAEKFPKDFVNQDKLEINKRILVEVVKKADMKKIFGTLKSKESGQRFKDRVREGWG